MSAYIGIDLSLRSTGLARFEDGAWECATVKSVGSVSDSPGMFVDRIDGVITRILEWVDLRDGDVVTIESPALHGKSSSLDRMFGAWWLVVSAITRAHGEPFTLTPSQVKKVATGNGNADKDAVLIHMVREFPDAPISGNDTADACALALASAFFDGHPIVDLSEKRAAPLRAVLEGRSHGL